jgi:hypothetical protein
MHSSSLDSWIVRRYFPEIPCISATNFAYRWCGFSTAAGWVFFLDVSRTCSRNPIPVRNGRKQGNSIYLPRPQSFLQRQMLLSLEFESGAQVRWVGWLSIPFPEP